MRAMSTKRDVEILLFVVQELCKKLFEALKFILFLQVALNKKEFLKVSWFQIDLLISSFGPKGHFETNWPLVWQDSILQNSNAV